jgi:hypothetical protein
LIQLAFQAQRRPAVEKEVIGPKTFGNRLEDADEEVALIGRQAL